MMLHQNPKQIKNSDIIKSYESCIHERPTRLQKRERDFLFEDSDDEDDDDNNETINNNNINNENKNSTIKNEDEKEEKEESSNGNSLLVLSSSKSHHQQQEAKEEKEEKLQKDNTDINTTSPTADNNNNNNADDNDKEEGEIDISEYQKLKKEEEEKAIKTNTNNNNNKINDTRKRILREFDDSNDDVNADNDSDLKEPLKKRNKNAKPLFKSLSAPGPDGKLYTGPVPTFPEILDTLLSNFIPDPDSSEFKSFEEMLVPMEEAWWYYTDEYCKAYVGESEVPTLGFRDFVHKMFDLCPQLARLRAVINNFSDIDEIVSGYSKYKMSIPCAGIIILDSTLSQVLLVKGAWKGAKWGFPKGKLKGNEDPLEGALREVKEETGAGIKSLIEPSFNVTKICGGKKITMFLACNVPWSGSYAPKVRNEIACIEWHRISNIVANKTMYANVLPFLSSTEKWIAAELKRRGRKSPPPPGLHTRSRSRTNSPVTPVQDNNIIVNNDYTDHNNNNNNHNNEYGCNNDYNIQQQQQYNQQFDNINNGMQYNYNSNDRSNAQQDIYGQPQQIYYQDPYSQPPQQQQAPPYYTNVSFIDQYVPNDYQYYQQPSQSPPPPSQYQQQYTNVPQYAHQGQVHPQPPPPPPPPVPPPPPPIPSSSSSSSSTSSLVQQQQYQEQDYQQQYQDYQQYNNVPITNTTMADIVNRKLSEGRKYIHDLQQQQQQQHEYNQRYPQMIQSLPQQEQQQYQYYQPPPPQQQQQQRRVPSFMYHK